MDINLAVALTDHKQTAKFSTPVRSYGTYLYFDVISQKNIFFCRLQAYILSNGGIGGYSG